MFDFNHKNLFSSIFCFFCLVFFITVSLSLNSYEVVFEGINDEEILKLVKSVSNLDKLKENPPPTLIGLKRRIKADMNPIIQALHSYAYYDSKVDIKLNEAHDKALVKVDLGPVFPFSDFQIHYFQNEKEVCEDILAYPITLKDLDVKIDSPALPEKIISAEDTLLDQLNLQGYAFAKILKREVLADQSAKNVVVIIKVDIGPLTYIGPTQIYGLTRLQKPFVLKKIRWREGEVYDPKKIEKTQDTLELSGLFQSVNINVAEKPLNENLMPIDITLIESKQRTIGFGLNYTIELGPGVTAEWEDRNIFGKGQKLSFAGNIWQRLQDVRANYLIPDYRKYDQNLIWTMDWHHERNRAYSETAFSFSGVIERKISEQLRISYGGMYKLLRSMRSANNRRFDLIKVPLQLRWTNTDSILEPTQGSTVQLKAIPSLQILSPSFAYSINTFTATHYIALTKDKKYVFANKLMLGSIFGANKHDIPPPERFYAGSENTIRGYPFLTISPRAKHDKPIGGRSLLVYTLEMRVRLGENFGAVLFYDIGNVYKNYLPVFSKGYLQSTGLGIRYYTPIGPLRLDVAFPLNRRRKNTTKHGKHRKYFDSVLEAYFSIGQSF